MCTSFVYRKHGTWIGMNFDNDGKDFKIATHLGGDCQVSVNVNGTYFPSFGISRTGLFVNDLMVDAAESGKYKRQSEKRWVTTSLVRFVMGEAVEFADVKNVLERVEIVNAPNQSTHNLIVERNGSTCLVEPGRKTLFTEPHDSDWYVMTNFALSDYKEVAPSAVVGSGADRYLKTLDLLQKLTMPMDRAAGFEILKRVAQSGAVWRTELSVLYDGVRRELFYCLDQNFDRVEQYNFDERNLIDRRRGG